MKTPTRLKIDDFASLDIEKDIENYDDTKQVSHFSLHIREEKKSCASFA